MWYTTEDAKRDAERQAKERSKRPPPPLQECSSLCAAGERCVITEDGECDVLAATDECNDADAIKKG